MRLYSCPFEDKGVLEVYLTVSPTAEKSVEEQSKEIFSAIKSELEPKQLRILQERVFVTQEAADIVRAARASVYGQLDDGVEPTWLVVPAGITGQISGVQVHAVGGLESPRILSLDDKPCGRIVSYGERKLMTLSGLSGSGGGSDSAQAKIMFERAESILKQEGTDFYAVARTWMWLRDILSWYDEFNAVRNDFFIERGLIQKAVESKMPASTGIGIPGDNDSICTMDLVAVIEPASSIEYLDAGGNQLSAFEYGSAFSRACSVDTPAGKTVYVSGTASIDHSGKTTNVGKAKEQIEDTVENVLAVFKEMNCKEEDIIHSFMYCKTREIEDLYLDICSKLKWPQFAAITNVCRDNLLFEIEATGVIRR